MKTFGRDVWTRRLDKTPLSERRRRICTTTACKKNAFFFPKNNVSSYAKRKDSSLRRLGFLLGFLDLDVARDDALAVPRERAFTRRGAPLVRFF